MTYREKLQQADKEARAAIIGLVVTIAVWALLGFGVAQTGVVILSTPLWVITGCIGTFICAVVVAIVMAKVVMKDVGFDEDLVLEGEEVEDAG